MTSIRRFVYAAALTLIAFSFAPNLASAQEARGYSIHFAALCNRSDAAVPEVHRESSHALREVLERPI